MAEKRVAQDCSKKLDGHEIYISVSTYSFELIDIGY